MLLICQIRTVYTNNKTRFFNISNTYIVSKTLSNVFCKILQKKVFGAKFQIPVGTPAVDNVSLKKKLVVEGDIFVKKIF